VRREVVAVVPQLLARVVARGQVEAAPEVEIAWVCHAMSLARRPLVAGGSAAVQGYAARLQQTAAP
jgi:hypothetical protein